VLATVGADGAPRARLLVLRGVDHAGSRLWLHSDARAGKISDIVAEPRVALTFWDPGRMLQLRLEGTAERVRDGDQLEAAWLRVPALSRRNYASADPPGGPLGGGGLLADGRRNFAVIMVVARRLEWLWLGAEPHLRGMSVVGDGEAAGVALQP
jgi:hypothetical protein